jgi:hypothetical protein
VLVSNAGPARASVPAALRSFRILEIELRIEGEDDGLAAEFASVFGEPSPETESPRATLVASLARGTRPGWAELRASGDGLADPAAFLLGFASPTVPLRAVPTSEAGATLVGLADDAEPAFEFRGESCAFRLVPRWRRIIANFLFLRMLRLRSDLIFFHAASVGIEDEGFLLVGPKGTGKSTLSASLAARGHAFLGDETAAYQPAAGRLLPFRRPIGIKPGPRAAAVARALTALGPRGDEEGLVRVPIESLLPMAPTPPLPLRGVVFLQGFGPQATITKIEAGREELSQMQPLASSLVAGATLRVFEMIRLLAATACYRLVAADPDETAVLVEEVLKSP